MARYRQRYAVSERRDRRRRAHGADQQPRPGLLSRARRDQARSGASTTWRSATASCARCASGRACCTATPTGVGGEKIYQKRLPRARPTGCRPRGAVPVRPDRRRAVRHGARQRHLGGADVDRRVPSLALAPRGHRAARTSCASTSTRSRAPGSRRPSRSPRSCTRCSTNSARSAGRRRQAARACTSTCASSRASASARCAAPRWPSPARSSGARRTW